MGVVVLGFLLSMDWDLNEIRGKNNWKKTSYSMLYRPGINSTLNMGWPIYKVVLFVNRAADL